MSRKFADVYDESTFDDIFIEGVSLSICHGIWECWTTYPQVDLIGIVFKAQQLLAIRKKVAKLASIRSQVPSREQYEKPI